MQVELRVFLECDKDTELQELENDFYHIDSIGSTFVDVTRVDVIDISED